MKDRWKGKEPQEAKRKREIKGKGEKLGKMECVPYNESVLLATT